MNSYELYGRGFDSYNITFYLGYLHSKMLLVILKMRPVITVLSILATNLNALLAIVLFWNMDSFRSGKQ